MGLFKEYSDTMLAIGQNIDTEVMWACVDLIKSCRQAHIIAAGNTAPLAQYMGFRLGRLGENCSFNIAPEYFMNHVNLAEKDDIVIAISQSGSSKSVVQGLELAMEKKLKSIAITAFMRSPVAELADYVLLSNSASESFDYYKNYSRLNEMAVIDAVLNLITNREKILEKNAYKPEFIMAETKY